MLSGRVYTVYNHLVKPYVSDLPGAFWVNRQLSKVNNLFVERPEGDVFRAVDGDWDVLVVLDACRYDYYRGFFPEAGKRVSEASHSREYFQENYSEGSFEDVVYVSANPHISPSYFRDSTGRELGEVFQEVHHLTVEEWDDEAGVVPPSSVVEKALEVEEDKPAKRKVIHFMQPHAPYITEEGFDGFMDVIAGDKSIGDLRDAYIRNIEAVLPEVERLAEEMDGRVVVTGDHGELLGEYGMFSHPYGLNAKELREVPWHVISDEEKEFREASEVRGIDF